MAYWDTLDESLTFQYMRGEDTSERTTYKRHVLIYQYARGKPACAWYWKMSFVHTLVNFWTIVVQ